MDASVVETHVSVVFFVGDRAYKLKKPVRFDFVDQSTRAARAALCHREVELNRRLAPDVYVDVATVSGSDGEPIDHLVVMTRLAPERRLARLVREGDRRGPAAVDEVAVRLAAFHAGARRSPEIDRAATADAVAGLWEANWAQVERFAGTMLDRDTFDRARERAASFVAGRTALFDQRIRDGFVCDGHGDLLADDIYVLDDGPRIIDCLEFADRLRFGDVVADLAFLAMDLERLGARPLAERLVSAYEEASAAAVPPALLHHWIAYRAQVRMLVACLRADQEEADEPDAARAAADQARLLLALADEHLARAMPKLVLVGGLPGTGKSTVAAGLGRAIGATVLRSDVVRKELIGVAPGTHVPASFHGGIYGDEHTERTYRELVDRAGRELGLGRTVVLDASFVAGRDRAAARSVAAAARAEVVELRCTLPAAEAHRRIEARAAEGDDPSDADALVAARMAELDDPWPESRAVPTTGTRDEAVAAAVALVTGTAR